MRLWWHQWVRWQPLYVCMCGYEPATHLHMLVHLVVLRPWGALRRRQGKWPATHEIT